MKIILSKEYRLGYPYRDYKYCVRLSHRACYKMRGRGRVIDIWLPLRDNILSVNNTHRCGPCWVELPVEIVNKAKFILNNLKVQ